MTKTLGHIDVLAAARHIQVITKLRHSAIGIVQYTVGCFFERLKAELGNIWY